MRHALSTSLLATLLFARVVAQAAGNGPAAQSPDETRAQLDQAERDRAAALAAQQSAAGRAAALAAVTAELAAQRSAAQAHLHQAEQATEEAASHTEALAAARRQAAEKLAEHAKAIEPLLPLVERLSLYPAETMLAVSLPPEDAVRGLLVLQGMAHRVAAEAAALRREQAALQTASDALAAETPKLAAAETAQAAAAAELDRQLALADQGRRDAQDQATAAATHAADLTTQAASLRALLDKLAQARRDGESRARADAARATREKRAAALADARRREVAFAVPPATGSIASFGSAGRQLLTPVVGNVVQAWGDPTDAGPAVGISYRAAPAARVVAPCAGRVMFAAPFRSYGKLLIIDCGGGYDAVLAGFDRLDAKLGTVLQAGDPVGVMPAWNPASARSHPSLYVELRRDGEPVNPAPWLRASS
jgi:septal ring factor EnvC (AmiA/AmiB activator)